MLAGICAGVSQVLVGHPFDTIKVRLQNKKLHFKNLYAGWKFPLVSSIAVNGILFPTYEMLRSSNTAFVSGMISGSIVTPIVFLSDVHKIQRQMGCQVFSMSGRGLSMTLLREVLAFGIYFDTYERVKQRTDSPLVSGACAGITNWAATYPFDVIRSRQMAQGISIREAFFQGSLYKGIGVCLFRAVLVNAAIFSTYELVSSFSCI